MVVYKKVKKIKVGETGYVINSKGVKSNTLYRERYKRNFKDGTYFVYCRENNWLPWEREMCFVDYKIYAGVVNFYMGCFETPLLTNIVEVRPLTKQEIHNSINGW